MGFSVMENPLKVNFSYRPIPDGTRVFWMQKERRWLLEAIVEASRIVAGNEHAGQFQLGRSSSAKAILMIVGEESPRG